MSRDQWRDPVGPAIEPDETLVRRSHRDHFKTGYIHRKAFRVVEDAVSFTRVPMRNAESVLEGHETWGIVQVSAAEFPIPASTDDGKEDFVIEAVPDETEENPAHAEARAFQDTQRIELPPKSNLERAMQAELARKASSHTDPPKKK